MAGLTTHILDLTHGQPACGVTIELYRLSQGERQLIKKDVTNDDGRLDKPFLVKEEMVTGTYEFVFHVGDYFHCKEVARTEPLFLDHVPVRFGIADKHSHYHVPLLISPYGYQIYRGS